MSHSESSTNAFTRSGLLNVFNRLDVAAAGVGALVTYQAIKGALAYFFIIPTRLGYLLGPHAESILLAIGTLSGAALGFLAVRLAGSLSLYIFPGVASEIDALERKEEKTHPPPDYILPPWPKPQGLFRLVLGERHRPSGRFVAHPSWYVLPEAGLFGGISAYGAIGSGKTQAVAYPFIEQLLGYRSRSRGLKPGGLVLDVKGNFSTELKRVAERAGRAHDIAEIALGGYRMNLIHAPELEPEAIGDALTAVQENLDPSAAKGEGRWVTDGVREVVTHIIGLHRLAYGEVTLADVKQVLDGPLRADSDGGEVPEELERRLSQFDKAFDKRLATGAPEESAQATYHHYRNFFTGQFSRDNPRNKATVVNAALNLIGEFSKPEVAHTFCARQEEINYPGMMALLDQGKVVCLSMGASEKLAQIVGMFLKLEFQRAVLDRVKRAAGKPELIRRIVFFLADEYQNFVSVAHRAGGQGDDNFFALSRESRCINLVLSQSPVSLSARIGKDRARVILANLRTKVFLSLTDAEDAELASALCGKDWKKIPVVTVAENTSGSRWNPVTRSTHAKGASVSESVAYREEKRALFEPIEFARLSTFQAIVLGFDGTRQIAPGVVYLKPAFADPMTPYPQIVPERGG